MGEFSIENIRLAMQRLQNKRAREPILTRFAPIMPESHFYHGVKLDTPNCLLSLQAHAEDGVFEPPELVCYGLNWARYYVAITQANVTGPLTSVISSISFDSAFSGARQLIDELQILRSRISECIGNPYYQLDVDRWTVPHRRFRWESGGVVVSISIQDFKDCGAYYRRLSLRRVPRALPYFDTYESAW